VTPGAAAAPGYWRRLVCLAYEGLLLFGVVMFAGLLYSPLAQQRHALQGMVGLQTFVFFVLGLYFVVFWTRGGQTLAMKTWHIRVVTADGHGLGWRRAAARYVLSWLWFVPALALIKVSGLTGGPVTGAAIAAGIFGYAALGWLRPDRQYWHDAVCGTRLVDWRVPQTPAAA
jgi:uncharacterized RDD family membrane protein YckC